MSLVANFPSVSVLCVGDVMLDRFIGGSVRRISPESPVPVLSMSETRVFAGGAANVARNIAALGGRCTLIGVVGTDSVADELARAVAESDGVLPVFVPASDRPTSEKTRFVAQGQQMLRADNEISLPVKVETEDQLIAEVTNRLAGHQALVLSDYAKGVLTDRVIGAVIKAARSVGVAVIVDPKSSDFSRYNGATLLTPNANEVHVGTLIEPKEYEQAIAAGRRVLETTTIDSILITRAEKGMMLVRRDGEPLQIPSRARRVADVVGAGDTVVATLALAIGAGGALGESAVLANAAAGIVVGKRGTATVSRAELTDEIESAYGLGFVPSSVKVFDRSQMRETADAWRQEGLKVGFTNGCFDILHLGHVSLLEFSRAHCDRLIIGLNADESVRRLKGPTRPINQEQDRARLLASLAVVDAVVIFGEDTPYELIDFLKPDVLVKGADYLISEIVGSDIVLANGGEVLRFELVPGRSTTATIAKSKEGIPV